jgi:hypothetical protein
MAHSLSNSLKTSILHAVAAILLLVILTACGGGNTSEVAETTPTAEGGTSTEPVATPTPTTTPTTTTPTTTTTTPTSASSCTPSETKACPATINYTLPVAGKVSINIYDASGNIVRNFLNAAQRAAGAHTETWDGKNDAGIKLASPSSYTYKLLLTQGLRAKYLMKVGTNLPEAGLNGPQYWGQSMDFGLGNQTSVESVVVDGDNIYAVAGGSENVAGSKKITLSGVAVWSGNRSASDIAILGDTAYYLFRPFSNGDYGQLMLYGVSKSEPNHGNEIPGWPTGEYSEKRDQSYTDIVAYDSGKNPQLILASFRKNAVNWVDTKDGKFYDSVSITSPRAVAIENNGNILAITGSQIVRFSRANKALVTVVPAIDGEPYRLAVDRTNGDILVVERKFHQILRYSSAGTLKATYGNKGGRADGLYNPANFRKVNSISEDGRGGFVISEDYAPRRIARFDASGKLVKEWYASTSGIAGPAVVDPDDGSVVWYASNVSNTQYVRAIIDIKANTMRVHSTVDFAALANGMLAVDHIDYPTAAFFEIKKYNNKTYLFSRSDGRDNRWVARYDESTGKVIPLSVLGLEGERYKWTGSFQWTDANGDGVVQSSESTRYAALYEHGKSRMPIATPSLSWLIPWKDDYKLVGRTGNLVPLLSWNSVGAPVYGAPTASVDFLAYPDDISWDAQQQGIVFQSNSLESPVFGVATLATGGSMAGGGGWGTGGDARVLKWDSKGKLIWELKPKTSSVRIWDARACNLAEGEVGVFADLSIVRSARGGIVAAGKDGAWNGNCPTPVYAWNEDGLWIGNLLSNPDLASIDNRIDMFQMSSEPWYISVVEMDNGDVLLYGNWENHQRVWQISGWNNWTHATGKINASQPDSMWTDSGVSRRTTK